MSNSFRAHLIYPPIHTLSSRENLGNHYGLVMREPVNITKILFTAE